MSATTHPLRRLLAAVTATLLVASLVVLAGPATPASAFADNPTLVFDDMEHGDPFGNGWFAFGGDVGGGGIGANTADLPQAEGGAVSLETGWGSGGTPGFYGGFGRSNPVDIAGKAWFNLWINPDPEQDYTLELNLQEDDNGDNAIAPEHDGEFQFDCVVSETGPCAVAGGGWQLVSVPLSDFARDYSYLWGGDATLDGNLVNVVVAVIGTGSDASFRTDYWSFTERPLRPAIIDDFSGALASGTDADGVGIGFLTFSDGSPISISTTAAPPAPAPDSISGGNALTMTGTVGSFAGYVNAFANAATDTWVPQDWSTYEGIQFWMYGQDTGNDLFIDILDNRNPGSTKDDAERFVHPFVDDFSGWQLLRFPFDAFTRKDIGNGAPNDGLGLFEMHGYAIGMLNTDGASVSYHVDDVAVYGVGEPPALAVQLSDAITYVEEGGTGQVAVRVTRAFGDDDPDSVSIDYATERSNAVAGEEYTPTSGTLTFTRGGPLTQTFAVETFDDARFEGDEQIVVRLTNPVGVERGAVFQGSLMIDDNDPFDPDVVDEFTQGAHLWDVEGPITLDRVRVVAGDAEARPGQDAVEDMAFAEVPLSVADSVELDEGAVANACRRQRGIVPLQLLSTPEFDATMVDHTTVTLGDAREVHADRRTGEARRHVDDVNGDGLDDLLFHFRAADIGASCGEAPSFNGETYDGQSFTAGGSKAALVRDFPAAQDWTATEAVSFWYRGAGGGEDVTVTLKDNRATDPGPSGWVEVWSDEFDEPAGTVPNPDNWAYEIGDTTPDGKNGWGNDELQYYTDDPDNAATDGNGNLVITLDEADGSQECYYGPCEFESARLLTQHKAEFAYGRIESRLLVPDGGDGLWPAFWSLGTDITYNPWPGAGEIDIMEYVSRLPDETFGTVHGPGYSGGGSVGDLWDFGMPVYEAPLAGTTETSNAGYHTFKVEWEPDLITWYVDDVQYHQVTPADVPGPWVFDKPFFLLLNFAIGGNFGGTIDPSNTYPQEYLVDYVRVFQGPDTAERFEATFTDDVDGWREVTIPLDTFTRSEDQPAGAPDDGLTLSDVWGVGLELPNGNAAGELLLDAVRGVPFPPPTELVVTSANDAGEGTLRAALGTIADGGTITFDSRLAGATIELAGGPIVLGRDVTIDGVDAPGLALSGVGTDRVLVVNQGADVDLRDLTLRDGYGFELAGCVLNNGTVLLERVTVTRCLMEIPATPGQFWQGGGGIYNGEGASLHLLESEVSNNTSGWAGGGVYSFFGTTTVIEQSTIAGNAATDVGGGMRLLSDATVTGATIAGNTAANWHGAALFVTDGVVDVLDSELLDNVSPGGTGAVFVGTFGDASATLQIGDSTLTGNQAFGCYAGFFGGGAVTLTSLGGNTFQDGTCNPVATDRVLP